MELWTEIRPKPKVGPHLDRIRQILEADKALPKKQRHTAKRIFERLCAEEGYTGGYTAVKDEVRQIAAVNSEVFVPLVHRPGEAQVDFGQALAVRALSRDAVAQFPVLKTLDTFDFQAQPSLNESLVRELVRGHYIQIPSSPRAKACRGGLIEDKTLNEAAESPTSKIWSGRIFTRKPEQPA